MDGKSYGVLVLILGLIFLFLMPLTMNNRLARWYYENAIAIHVILYRAFGGILCITGTIILVLQSFNPKA